MPNHDAVATSNNNASNKEEQISVNCDLLWSLAQQFSYLRLCDKNHNDQYQLIGLYAARARRIAATYARFYLEIEEGGDPSKIGRYYWMALGAFASKTVACLLDSFQLQGGYFAGKASLGTVDLHEIANGLAKGNLWLFGDIAPPHWFYNKYPEHFFNGMACLDCRHVNSLVTPVANTVNALPWAGESLPKVGHFEASADLIKGFEYVVQIESMPNSELRLELQLDHLMAIADHEQGAILQPLIYDDAIFAKWTARQRIWIFRMMAPKYELVFTRRCSERDQELKSIAPDDMIVEDFRSRMEWITSAAAQFHRLMSNQSEHMLEELRAIAAWVRSPDARWVY